MMHRIEAGHHVTARGPERERFDGPDHVPRPKIRLSTVDARLADHRWTQIQADGHHLRRERGGDVLTDRIEIPPGAGGDVEEPHRAPQVHTVVCHRLRDDTHGIEIQLAQLPIPGRHRREVVAQTRDGPLSVRPRARLDRQFSNSSVEEAGRHASRLAGGAPRRAPAPDRDPVAVEDQRAVGVAACPRVQWSRMWVKTSEAKSPAPNRATPLSGAAIRSRNGMRHPLRRIVGTATAVKLSTMTHPDRTR